MADSLHEAVMDSLVALLAGGVPAVGGRVFKHQQFNPAVAEYPCLCVSYDPAARKITRFSFGRDQREFPLQVELHGRQSVRDAAALPDWLEAQQQVDGLLVRRRPYLAGCWSVEASEGPALDLARAKGPGYQQARAAWTVLARVLTERADG